MLSEFILSDPNVFLSARRYILRRSRVGFSCFLKGSIRSERDCLQLEAILSAISAFCKHLSSVCFSTFKVLHVHSLSWLWVDSEWTVF
jgi:hypothetical protein